MSINIGPPAIEELRPRITVIGVGGAGGNAIANMINAGVEGIDFVVANTDAQALKSSITEHRIQLGADITKGLGAGARPEVGKAAAEESLPEIERALEGVHMCFIAAGMGGGTGAGAAPVIAKAARDKGVLTVGIVTKPFLFEGTRRMRAAEASIEELQRHVDTLIVIPNQNLFLVATAETTFKEAFALADEVLQQGVRSITDLMVMPGLINLDFADVRSVMGEMGKAMMGTGEGQGENRALEAAERAIANPLLDGVSMQGAKGVIISIIGGDDMKLLEVDEAATHIRDLVEPDANIIWGSAFNPDLQGKIRISVVATGIEQSAEQAEIAARPINLIASRGPMRPTIVPPSAPEPVFRPAAVAAPEPVAGEAEEIPVANDLDLDDFAEETRAFDLTDGDASNTDDKATTAGYASLTGFRPSRGEALDLALENGDEQATANAGSDDGQDGLMLNANLPPEGDALLSPPMSPRGGGGSPAESGPRPVEGNTLFERMAILSRRVKPAVANESDEEDEGDGSAISNPRPEGNGARLIERSARPILRR